MRSHRATPVLLAALAVTVPASIAGSVGTASAEGAAMPAPTVTSTDYPDDSAWHGGVGIYGDFTIDDPSDRAVRYEVTIDGRRFLHLPTQNGEPVTVAIAPYRSGPFIISVGAIGPEGENGPRTDYWSRANAGSAPKAWWKLDEPAGTRTLAAQTREGEEPVTARAIGRFATGAEGQSGTAARLSGGRAQTPTPVDTTKSFTISAWARPTAEGDSVVAAATGHRRNAFSLQSRDGHWAFVQSAADSRGAATTQAVAEQPVYADTWAHLTGSYDATQKRLRLWVNGILASDVAAGDTAWDAQRFLRIGAGVHPQAHAFRGDVDEVRVLDRIIVPDEAAALPRLPKQTRARWKFNTDGSDDSAFGNDMTLRGGAAIDPGAGFDEWGSPAGLMLDGTGAYAEAAGPVIRTDRSFTVTAWANPGQATSATSTLLSLPGDNANRFALRYQPETGWQLAVADSDSADASTTVARQWTLPGEWAHIAVVYDAPTRTVILYANGIPAERTGVGAFNAEGALQIGRSAIGEPEYWRGAVDDVWAIQGALSPEQVSMLYAPFEFETSDWPA
ncbi:LamG domain-containing protein [Actinomadura chokoriensis]|uniref:LamG domain-containing protein n=1 Tax=Actinomadura chokoriensis TaxID=454156 RepID=UPI0031F7DAD4